MGVAPAHFAPPTSHAQVTVVHYRIPPQGMGEAQGVYFSGPFCQLYRGVSCERRRSHQFGLNAFNQRFPNFGDDLQGEGVRRLSVNLDNGKRRSTIHGLETMEKDKEDDTVSLVSNMDGMTVTSPQADACSVCLRNPPKEPVTCSYCKKVVACRGCLHTWFVSINSDPKNVEAAPGVDFGSCLLCRHKWRKIKKNKEDKGFTMI